MRTLHQLLMLGLLLLCTGCELRVDTELDLEPDGSGRLTLGVTVDAELQSRADAAGVDPLGRAAQRIEAAQTTWDVDLDESSPESRTLRISSDVDEPGQVQVRIDELREALAADEATLLGPLAVTVDDEARTIQVQGEVVALVGQAAAEDAGMSVEQLSAELVDVVETSLTIRAPGPLLNEVAAATVVSEDPEDPQSPVVMTWTAGPGERVPVAALIEQPSQDLLRLMLQAGAAVLAVMAIAGGVLAQRSRGRQA